MSRASSPVQYEAHREHGARGGRSHAVVAAPHYGPGPAAREPAVAVRRSRSPYIATKARSPIRFRQGFLLMSFRLETVASAGSCPNRSPLEPVAQPHWHPGQPLMECRSTPPEDFGTDRARRYWIGSVALNEGLLVSTGSDVRAPPCFGRVRMSRVSRQRTEAAG